MYYMKVLQEKIVCFASDWQGGAMRLALAIVYVWFGMLKVVGQSPATPLVDALLHKTLPFLTFDQFIIPFGLFEVGLGLLFLWPRATWWAMGLLAAHLVMIFSPLVLLPHMVWTGAFVPTLEGQYIIKNVMTIALALGIIAKRKVSKV